MEYLHTGERRAIIDESVRGTDLYIITDVVNNSTDIEPAGVRFGAVPDEHFQDLKRIISACHGSAHRINVIMPFLYEGRFNNRRHMESLDCAISLKDIADMGISNIITFDAHEARVQNALPILGIDNYPTSYQFIEAILNDDNELTIDKDSLIFVSPDIGGMGRVVFYSSILGVNMGMFYIRKDYSQEIGGEHPIVAIEFLGGDITGKDTIIVDDMIDTGESMIKTARELKKRGARKVIIASTYGLFNEGLDKFDELYNEGILNKIYTTNLTYCSKELLAKPYHRMVDMSMQIAQIIETLNHDLSLADLVDHSALIIDLLKSNKKKAE
jgi:ribose-phosphate pyrophosphokinase